MNFLKKKMTWGGLLGLCALVLVVLAGAICRALGVHKLVGDKLREIKKKLW